LRKSENLESNIVQILSAEGRHTLVLLPHLVFERAVEFREKPKEGVAGITYLFDKLAEECELHPGIILSLFAYLADLKRPPKPFPVKVEEKKINLSRDKRYSFGRDSIA
jgi:hypothetical protein